MIDLHVHSTFSDGTETPEELVKRGAGQGLVGMAITDHDTAEGTAEAVEAAEKIGITVVSGIELSVFSDEGHFHLLGYDFDWHEQALVSVLRELQESRKRRNKTIIAKLRALGIDVEYEELRRHSGNGQTGRPHIARLLREKGVVGSIDQAFSRYLKKGACAYVSRHICHVAEAIDLLHGAGGVAVLAHPAQISSSFEVLDRLVRRLMDSGLDGIETFYPTQNGKILRRLRRLAARYDLLETGGSDYHGDIRPGTAMAGENGLGIPDELLEKLLARRSGNSATTTDG